MKEPFAAALDVGAIRALYRPPRPSAIEKDVGIWAPETWPADDELPSVGEVGLAFTTNPDETLESIEREQRESLLHRLE